MTDDRITERTGLVHRRSDALRLQLSGSHHSSHGAQPLTSLSSRILRRMLLHLPVPEVARLSGVCTTLAGVSRSDTLWAPLLALHWRQQPTNDLECRVQEAIAHHRHGADGHTPLHAPLSEWTNQQNQRATADGMNEEKKEVSPSAPLPVTPILVAQSGIPRARSAMNMNGLNSTTVPPTIKTSGLLCPRPMDQFHLNVSSLQTTNGSDSETHTPFERGTFDDHEEDPSQQADTPTNASSSTNNAAKRWCAAPDSLKAIFQDTLIAAHQRFDYLGHLQQADNMDPAVEFQITSSLFVSGIVWIMLHFISDPSYYSGDAPSRYGMLLHPAVLSFVFTTSMSLLICAMGYNVVRILVFSILAKTAIWRCDPGNDETVFQVEDKAWWRRHVINRWYLVRYQVWHPPVGSIFLLYFAGIGLFIGIWIFFTMLLCGWPAIGALITLLVPAIVSAVVFQLGRMLFFSRFTHLFVSVLLTGSELAIIVYMIHAQNPLLMWLLDHSLFLAFIHVVISFTPNLLLLFCILWITDDYLVLGWTPIILPPIQHPNLDEPLSSSPSVSNLNSISTPGHDSPMSAVLPAFSWPSSSTSDPRRTIPPPHTLGRVVFGTWIERKFVESRLANLRTILCSRGGLSVMGGIIIYGCSQTYWSLLFDLYLDPASSFSALAWPYRFFHWVSLIQHLMVSVIVTFLVIIITLQNRNWQWWWLTAYTNITALACGCIHFALWQAATEHEYVSLLRHGTDSATDASFSVLFGLQQHFSSHWFYSWTTWCGLLCVTTAVSLCLTLFALVMLYRPKNVEPPRPTHRRPPSMGMEQEDGLGSQGFNPNANQFYDISNSNSEVSLVQLAPQQQPPYHNIPPPRTHTPAPRTLSFFESLQASSPGLSLMDEESFQEHVRDQAQAAAAATRTFVRNDQSIV